MVRLVPTNHGSQADTTVSTIGTAGIAINDEYVGSLFCHTLISICVLSDHVLSDSVLYPMPLSAPRIRPKRVGVFICAWL